MWSSRSSVSPENGVTRLDHLETLCQPTGAHPLPKSAEPGRLIDKETVNKLWTLEHPNGF